MPPDDEEVVSSAIKRVTATANTVEKYEAAYVDKYLCTVISNLPNIKGTFSLF